MAMLKLKGSKFQKELERFSIEQDLYILYVELLDASGKMMEFTIAELFDGGIRGVLNPSASS